METDSKALAHRHGLLRRGAAGQRGAVLYVALIILILLALIGIAGMQVAGMQERMAANFLRGNVAFQNAEGELRVSENLIQDQLYATGTFAADQDMCAPTFDPLTWAGESSLDTDRYVRRVDKCFPASSIIKGQSLSKDTGNIYEVSALSTDRPDAPGASAVLNTIFIP